MAISSDVAVNDDMKAQQLNDLRADTLSQIKDSVLHFDEGNDEVNMGDVLDFTGTNPFTLEGWLRWDAAVATGSPFVVSKRITDGGGDQGYALLVDKASSRVTINRYRDGVGQSCSSSTGSVPAGQWVHVAGVYDGTNLRTYVNGAADGGPNASANSLLDNAANLQIGLKHDDTYDFLGEIAEVRIWDDVRTPTEIMDNRFTRLTGNEANLVGYWKLNEGTGTSVEDLSGSNFDGTITGAEWKEATYIWPSHRHEGHPSTGRDLPPDAITPQGEDSRLLCDRLDGEPELSFMPYYISLHKYRPAAGRAGRVFLPSDVPSLVVYDDGTEWHYVGADPARVTHFSSSCLIDPQWLVAGTGWQINRHGMGIRVTRIGSAALSVESPLSEDNAEWALTTGTTAKSVLGIHTTNQGAGAVDRAPIIMRARIKQNSSSSYDRRFYFGLMDSIEEHPSHAIAFYLGPTSAASDAWTVVTKSEGSSTGQNLWYYGWTPGVYRLLEIMIENEKDVRFFIDGTLVARHTHELTIPLSNMFFGISASNWYGMTDHSWFVSGLQYIANKA